MVFAYGETELAWLRKKDKRLGEVIDRIEVQNPDNLAESDLWVSFQVQGEGLRNDVDFSAQPYLWLSAPKSSRRTF